MSADAAARAIVALLLIIIALAFLPAWLLSLWRTPALRRCDDPAAPVSFSAGRGRHD